MDAPLRLGTFETILLAELRVGLPPLFYTGLLDVADDWSFILKLHSFFEGTLTKLLEEKLKAGIGLHESVTPRDSFVSRVHLAERLSVIEPDYRAFLLALNRLRNDITHNIQFIDFELAEYVDDLSDSDFRRTAVALCAGFKNIKADALPALLEASAGSHVSVTDRELGLRLRDALQKERKVRPARDLRTVREFFWHQNPKLSLWYAGVWTLDLLSLHSLFEDCCKTGFRLTESDAEAKLQDLLLDDNVLAYKRKVETLWEK